MMVFLIVYTRQDKAMQCPIVLQFIIEGFNLNGEGKK